MDMASPRQGGTPAQAEGSMPEELRNLYRATEQGTEQVKEQAQNLTITQLQHPDE